MYQRSPTKDMLTELIELRLQKYPGMYQRDFARKFLGVSRLHMTNVEQGRRKVSLELALKWLDALAPEAKMNMFGDVPMIEKRVDALRRLKKLAPEVFKAA